ncbi:Hydrolase, haloacid delahogenase-like family [hydrothermal vent metagenome]|uniref:Hydrolase, haloacid delahogenase-like family n=1 Tax=hydrothermal vent metagenome TaxID=652676 RepID=A0A3B0TZL9_9ZZZZ
MPADIAALSTIGFDADDTLWHNEQYFKLTEARFTELLVSHTEAEDLSSRLLDAERRNLALYGYGVKGFTLSMIETAIEVTGGKVPASTLRQILHAGRDLLAQPIEILPHAKQTLERFAGTYRLILITKGDLFDQERKIAQSGLAELFDAVEIVSEKTAATYETIFTRHGDGPARAMMVGNSLRSDICPAIAAGSWGVHVPHDLNWAHEHAQEPKGASRYRRVAHLGEVAGLIDELGFGVG